MPYTFGVRHIRSYAETYKNLHVWGLVGVDSVETKATLVSRQTVEKKLPGKALLPDSEIVVFQKEKEKH